MNRTRTLSVAGTALASAVVRAPAMRRIIPPPGGGFLDPESTGLDHTGHREMLEEMGYHFAGEAEDVDRGFVLTVPGIGKTRVMEEHAERLRRRGVRTMIMRPSQKSR